MPWLRRARSWHRANLSGSKGNCMLLKSLLLLKARGGPERSVQPSFIPNTPSKRHPYSNGSRYAFRERQENLWIIVPALQTWYLDLYARKKRIRDQSFDQTLLTWYKQLVSACLSLVESNTCHGDIKERGTMKAGHHLNGALLAVLGRPMRIATSPPLSSCPIQLSNSRALIHHKPDLLS